MLTFESFILVSSPEKIGNGFFPPLIPFLDWEAGSGLSDRNTPWKSHSHFYGNPTWFHHVDIYSLLTTSTWYAKSHSQKSHSHVYGNPTWFHGEIYFYQWRKISKPVWLAHKRTFLYYGGKYKMVWYVMGKSFVQKCLSDECPTLAIVLHVSLFF